ncbi:swirm domain-containing protein, partial [Cystoisospora suis]
FVGTGLHGGEREEKYKQIRNLIVVAYRANPLRHLSFSDCRQQVVACDSSLLLRIHSFLDFWGIINFQANPATVPTAVSRRKAFLLKDIKAMEKSRSASVASRPLHAARNLLRDFSSFFPSSSSSSFSSSSSSFFSDIDLEDGSRREGSKFSSSSLPASLGGRGPWRCAACSVSLGLLETCVWCMRCFADGRFPSILNPRQFLKVTIPILTGEDEDEEEEATREESTRHNSHTSPSTASTTMHKEGAGTPAGSPQIEESPASSSSSSTNTWTLEDIEKLI